MLLLNARPEILQSEPARTANTSLITQCEGTVLYKLSNKTALFSLDNFWDPAFILDAGNPVCILEVTDFIFLPIWYRVETANGNTGWLSETALGTSREYLDLKYTSRPMRVILPPAALGLDPFYQKYLDAQGLPCFFFESAGYCSAPSCLHHR